jgi:undecaprenyl-diphosphatase
MTNRPIPALAVAAMFRNLDDWEAGLLRRLIVAPTRPYLRVAARVVNQLGNGWLFGALAIAMPIALGARGWGFVRSVAIALALGFAMYPFIKKALARVRPCHAETSLDAGVRPLDRYSCPSGHSMTAAIFVVPLVLLFPIAAPLFLAVWLLIGWSRLALGHHYPSDVVFGGAIGTLISAIVCLWQW